MGMAKKGDNLTSSERYQRAKLARQYRSQHDQRIASLSMNIVRDFEGALEEFKPECVLEPFADGTWPKSPWTDWSSNPEDEEPYDRPTRQQARLMCEDCPLAKMCLDWALATKLTHGVVGGRILENGILEK